MIHASAVEIIAKHFRDAGLSASQAAAVLATVANIGTSDAAILQWMRERFGWRRFFMRLWWKLQLEGSSHPPHRNPPAPAPAPALTTPLNPDGKKRP